MNPLAELLDALGADPSALSDEALAQALTDIRAAAADIDPASATDEDLDLLDRAAGIVESFEAESDTRETAAVERAERAQALADRIAGPQGSNEDPDPVEVEDPDAVVDPPEVEAPEGEPVAIAAAVRPRGGATANARRPRAMTPEAAPSRDRPMASLVASANNPTVRAGEPMTELQVAESMIAAFSAARAYRGAAAKINIGGLGFRHPVEQYGEERTLRRDPEDNFRKIREVTGRRALAASGGICAPPVVRYDLPNLLGTADRPVRNALARFGADRGAVTTLAPITLADVDTTGAGAGVSIWSNTTDTTPGASVKPCLVMTCPDDSTTVVDAITKCLEVGNFRARFFPEQVQEWLDHLDVWHARFAEREMLDTIGTGSKHVTHGRILGTAKDILTMLDQATSEIRNVYRLPDSFRFRWMAPRWLRDQMRADLVRELPGGTHDERFATADADFARWLDIRGINPTWLLEGETGQDYGPQGTGGIQGFKATAVQYLFPEGTWLWLDAAGFDFGIVRDSVLNETNDYRIFSETFEAVHFHGVESWRIASTICADGSTSSTIDIDPCTTGS